MIANVGYRPDTKLTHGAARRTSRGTSCSGRRARPTRRSAARRVRAGPAGVRRDHRQPAARPVREEGRMSGGQRGRVTGGAGFIGSHLVRLLVERGERVRVLDRPGAKLDHLPLDRIDVVAADIRDRAAVRRGPARVRRRLPPRGQPATLDAPPRRLPPRQLPRHRPRPDRGARGRRDARAAHQHREHPDPIAAIGADRGGPGRAAARRDRAVLPVEVPGRAVRLPPRPRRRAGRGREPDAADRPGRLGPLAADADDARLLPRQARRRTSTPT